MIVLRFFLRPLLRLVVLATVTVVLVWAMVGRPITQRVNGVLANALHKATSSVASHDLAVLRERLDTANGRLKDARLRRGRLATLLDGTKAQQVTLHAEAAKSQVVLKEIASLLGSPGPVVMVADKPYSRQTVEQDATQTVRRYEQVTGQLRDLDGQIVELKEALRGSTGTSRVRKRFWPRAMGWFRAWRIARSIKACSARWASF